MSALHQHSQMLSRHHINPLQFSSVAQSCLTLPDPMGCSMPGSPGSITISWSLLKLMLIETVMSSNHLILCCPLLLLPSILPSIRVFSSESVLRIRWPKIQTLFRWLYNCGTSKSIWPLETSIQDESTIILELNQYKRLWSHQHRHIFPEVCKDVLGPLVSAMPRSVFSVPIPLWTIH